jgi:hypothetical protein
MDNCKISDFNNLSETQVRSMFKYHESQEMTSEIRELAKDKTNKELKSYLSWCHRTFLKYKIQDDINKINQFKDLSKFKTLYKKSIPRA